MPRWGSILFSFLCCNCVHGAEEFAATRQCRNWVSASTTAKLVHFDWLNITERYRLYGPGGVRVPILSVPRAGRVFCKWHAIYGCLGLL